MEAFANWILSIHANAKFTVNSSATLLDDYHRDASRPRLTPRAFAAHLARHGFAKVRMCGGAVGYRLPVLASPSIAPARDFTPTADQITLHGLGFIQVKLEGNQRLHVWHPDLPRRSCYAHSAVHNHRFSFLSRVLVGSQVNRIWLVGDPTELEAEPTHDRISHDGARSPKGGRLSYVAGQVVAQPLEAEVYLPGQSYIMPELRYHDTPNDGIVVTIVQKLTEGEIHACSLIERGHEFDQDFDRFQLPPERLWTFVQDAMRSAA